MGSGPRSVVGSGSFLRDEDLRSALEVMFRQGTYDTERVRHASYELRLGPKVTVYKRPEVSSDGLKYDEFLPIIWETDENGRKHIDIWPRKRALLYTQEEFQFPDDFVGFVLSRGLLFARGLTPETTYVDPGFQGEYYITVVNVNENAVRLYQGMPLARLFVFRLPSPVEESYVRGSEKGIEQQLLEIPVTKVLSDEELKAMKDHVLLERIQEGCSIGDLLNRLISSQIGYRRRSTIWLSMLTLALLSALAWPTIFKYLIGARVPDWLGGQFVGAILSTILTLVVSYALGKFKDRRSLARSSG